MSFQRSYSKVWWGSLQENPSLYNNYNYHNHYQYNNNNGNEFHSLDETHLKSSENLSRIVETEETSPSKSWNNRHDSPGSLKSQDSGFSDNEELLSNAINIKISPTKSDRSETASVSTVETPPTVIRRKKNLNLNSSDNSNNSSNKSTNHNYENYRISFSAPSSPISLIKNHDFYTKIDKINLNSSNQKDNMQCSNTNTPKYSNSKNTSIKRRKGVNQKVRRNLLLQPPISTDNSIDFKNYNNETVYIGGSGIVELFDKNHDDIIDVDKNINHENDNNNNNNNNISNKYEKEMLFNASLSPKLSTSVSNNENHDFVTNTSTPKNLGVKILSSTPSSSSSLASLLPSPSISKHSNILESVTEINNTMRLPYHFDYPNPNLNGNSLSVQYWLNDIRLSYCHEVMSTLQTKSISQEAYKHLKINTTIIGKIIRQLQTKAMILQNEFERVEKILNGDTNTDYSLYDAIHNSRELIENVINFVKILERRSVFFTTEITTIAAAATTTTTTTITNAKMNRKKFHDNIEQMKLLIKDLKISLDKLHYLDLQSLIDDIQLLKRYILITIQMIFEKLMNIIVVNIENTKCDLMLRAHINMISTLSNMDYIGFSSLNNAFNKNEIVHVLLLICIENKLSSIRALTLRALSTICSSKESINQLCNAGGIEIIKDIIACDIKNTMNRTEPEKREAISLLTQITAPWHGTDHKVSGLKDCVESIVEGLTDIIVKTNCCQTLLLCAASLNNLSRLEVTSIYSIMSNETVLKLKDVIEGRGPGISIFLSEQIVSMLQNMSINKRCYSHLTNIDIINFLIYIFNIKFYEKFNARAENDSKRRTIKIILFIFKRLIQESIINYDTIENLFIPIFTKIEKNFNINSSNPNYDSNYKFLEEYHKDITILNQQMNDSLLHKSFNRSNSSRNSNNSNLNFNFNLNSNNGLKTSITIHESYV